MEIYVLNNNKVFYTTMLLRTFNIFLCFPFPSAGFIYYSTQGFLNLFDPKKHAKLLLPNFFAKIRLELNLNFVWHKGQSTE